MFEPRDVENDPAARAELAALGLRNVPVTVVGDTAVSGFNPDELARLFGLSRGADKKVADAGLFETLDKVLTAVIRAARQVPPDALMWTTPDRDRPLKVFCYHILADPNHVLDAIAAQTYDGSFKLTYGEAAAAFGDMSAIAAYGEKTRARLKAAAAALTPEELGRSIEGYAGRTDGHELLHQVLSHSAHHLRQLYDMLRRLGVAPGNPLQAQDLAGIPMPEELW